jgi:3-dehydroquinate synthase
MRLTVAVTPPYAVHVAPGLFTGLAAHVTEQRVALVCDSHTEPLYGEAVAGALRRAGKTVARLVVPAGEQSKSLAQFGALLEAMVEAGLDRTSAVLALGGGVVGDLAGFAAASFMRGIAFYPCPTSLLAMVDASVGGKTGINLPQGKNLVGAFWQPRAVFVDVTALRTLPEREFRQGAVEVFKHGLLADPWLLDHLFAPRFAPDGPSDFLTELIGRAIKVKADLVAADPLERGPRAYLNLGHTLAHALEAHSHHRLTHGDAVAYGLLFAAALAKQRGFADETPRVRQLIAWLQPAPLPVATLDELFPYLYRDKKTLAGKLRFVLLREPGRPILVDDVTEEELRAAWRTLQEVV